MFSHSISSNFSTYIYLIIFILIKNCNSKLGSNSKINQLRELILFFRSKRILYVA